MNRLKDSFELTEDKTRLANMLRNAKVNKLYSVGGSN